MLDVLFEIDLDVTLDERGFAAVRTSDELIRERRGTDRPFAAVAVRSGERF